MPKQKRKTIGFLLTIVFLIMAVIPALIITWDTSSQELEGSKAQILSQLNSVAKLKQANINRWVSTLQGSLADLEQKSPFDLRAKILLKREHYDVIARGVLRPVLQIQIDERHLFDEIFLLDLKRVVVLSTNQDNEGVYLPLHQRPYFRPALEKPYTELLGVATLSKYNSVVAARPVYDNNGKVLGVLAGRANMDVLNQIIGENAGLGQTGETYLVGKNNYLLTELPGVQVQKVQTEGVNTALETQDSRSGAYTNYHDKPVLGMYHWLPELKLILVVEQEAAEAFAPTYAILSRNVFVAGFAAILAIVVGLVVTRQITKPLVKLTNTALNIAEGEHHLTADEASRGEIGTLAAAFNSMTSQLRLSIARLKKQVDDLRRTEDALRQSEAKYRDLSKQLEARSVELEEKNEALQRMDRLKDEFLANTSHELRTPLNGIIGIAESMTDGATGPISQIQEKNLSMIVVSGKRLSSMIDDILDLSRLKHETLVLNIKPMRVKTLVEVVLTLSYPLLQNKPLTLINNISSKLPAVYGDENRVQQILHNLVGNAIKFTETGIITVSAELVEHNQVTTAIIDQSILPSNQPPSSQQYLAIHITDTGVGIASDKIERIFEAFEQEDGSVARTYGGTGLGLAITQQLVELHGGKIWVDSTPDQGSTFSFTLAVSDELVDEQALEISLDQQAELLKHSLIDPDITINLDSLMTQEGQFDILVVDDEPINRQVLVNHLSVQQYRVAEAIDGLEALQLIQAGQRFDLIVLDVMMPRMSGYEVCRELRREYPATELPIIMLTAKNRVDDLVAGFEAGANDYLIKPFSKAELLVRIQTHLQLNNLRALNASKDKFFSIVSHDLRSPFTPLLGMSELLVESSLDASREDILTMSRGINRAAQNVYNLLETLLQWSRLQRGHLTHHPEIFDIKEMIDRIVELLTINAEKKGIMLLNHVSAGLFVDADQNMLNTVIRNLISNAIKFTTRGGRVLISSKVVTKQDDSASTDLLELSVIDSGVGMSQENLTKLFVLETQHSTRGTDQEGGTGLGLIICQEMVRKNGGDISVESEQGEGTTVIFTIPLDHQQTMDLPNLTSVIPAHYGEPQTEESFPIPSVSEMERLFKLATMGDMKGIKNRATHLLALDEAFKPFADKLHLLADQFEDEALLLFVEGLME
ncbi:ATP-binding protein [Anaerolineales bacterium HSG6]|nr:ATP-binding protein [Anaerolineales bacterium HSG6]MDM8530939.1 ATP-binding protein [Anaerolineales bacterium HSG25]